MNFFFFFLNIKHTHHLSHICYTNKKCCSECFTFFKFSFLFSVVHRSCKQSAIFYFFFPVNTDKEKEKENQLHRTMKRKGQLFWSGTERGRGSDVGHEAQRSVQMTTFRGVVHLEFLRPVCDPSPRVVPLHGP